MAGTPAYKTDLKDVTLSDALGTWVELAGHKGGSAPVSETDYYIQGTACVSQATGQSTDLEAGMGFDYGSAIPSWRTGYVFLFWQVLLAANNVYPYAQGGLRLGIGSSNSDYNWYAIGGDDLGRNPYGGWQNIALDPTLTADYVEGTPTADTYQWFGSLPNMRAAITKGNPHGVDAIRWGRGAINVSAGEPNDPCTFAGMGAANDAQSARWGLFQEQPGGYLWKGLMQIGSSFSSATSAYFVDANANITVDNTPKVYREFNKIEFGNTESYIYWTGVNVLAASATQLSRGIFEMAEDCDATLDTCSFTDMDYFTFLSNNQSCLDTTFRRCNNVLQSGAIFTRCIFEESTAGIALSANDLQYVTYCDFTRATNRGGQSHAISCNVSGSIDFYGNTFNDYGASGTVSAAFYNNSGALITLNIFDGGDSPTVYNAPDGSTTDIVLAVSHTLTGLVSGSEVTYQLQGVAPSAAGAQIYHVENANTPVDIGDLSLGYKTTYSYNYVEDRDVDIYVHKVGYVWYPIRNQTLSNTNQTIPVFQQLDRNYNNP
jgi:hypothetical protein